jgi:hypothetical protein
VLHVFAQIWGGPGGARALVEATLAGGLAAAAAGAAESDELKQTVREMRQTLLARSLTERAHAHASALGLMHSAAEALAAAGADAVGAPTTPTRPRRSPAPPTPTTHAVACGADGGTRRSLISSSGGARGGASRSNDPIVIRRPSVFAPHAHGGRSPVAERQVSSRLGTHGVGAIQARERKPAVASARKLENDDSSELLNRLASVGRPDEPRLHGVAEAIQTEIGVVAAFKGSAKGFGSKSRGAKRGGPAQRLTADGSAPSLAALLSLTESAEFERIELLQRRSQASPSPRASVK